MAWYEKLVVKSRNFVELMQLFPYNWKSYFCKKTSVMFESSITLWSTFASFKSIYNNILKYGTWEQSNKVLNINLCFIFAIC